VTYARYVVELGSDAALPAHSGLATGMPSAALNGIQIRPLAAMPVDAGVAPTIDAPANGETSGDAGTTTMTSAPSHGGCATDGRNGWFAAVVVALGLARRRRVLR
jgi:MYXO-CTERM domain-containing protein